jgi:hypothetical protein
MGRKSKNQASNVDGNNGATEQDEFVEPTTSLLQFNLLQLLHLLQSSKLQ